MEDRNAPEVVFTAPAASAAFKSSLTVTGSVVDYDGDGQPRAGAFSSYISSVAYYLDGAENEALELDVSSSGGFSFTLATADYDSQITIVVTATDRNGNVGSASLTLAPDAEGPFLAITSPQERDEYGTLVTLAGYVAESSDDTSTAEIASVAYEIRGSAITGALHIDAKGAFSTRLDVSDLSGSQTVAVTATDLNGNETA